MTIDKQKLKALAEAAIDSGAHYLTRSLRVTELANAVSPETILALLAEIERLKRALQEEEGRSNMSSRAHRVVSHKRESVERERDQLKAENEALRNDAERYRFVRNPIGTSSPLAIWNEGKMPLFSSMADAVVDEFMAKEASHG